jgi:hypothetical protein
MSILDQSVGNHNEFLRHFLLSETEKSPQEILRVFREKTTQLPPEEFLARLPHPDHTIIQYFDDAGENKRKAEFGTRFDPKQAKRKQLEGCGVYFSVNAFNGKRRKENLRALRAFYLDWDAPKVGANTENEIAAAKVSILRRLLIDTPSFMPHVIIETRNGLHLLWLIDFEGKALDPDEYRLQMDAIVQCFGGDTGARDVTRVLRLPGLLHLKDLKNPFPIIFLYHDLP